MTSPRRSSPGSIRATVVALILIAAGALAGCSPPLVLDQPLPQQIDRIGCVSRCQAVKDRCDDDARYDYRQCQAGYSDNMRDYRWCRASSAEDCGYPWWSCAENSYGYCINRFSECRDACMAAYP
jgi:hypothetical protein